jgi:choice-of-anchor C domain-containing protein
MKKIISILSVSFLAFVCAATVFAAGSNGSFETGTDPGSFLTVNAPDLTTIADWTVDSGSVDYIGTYWAAADGLRSIDLDGSAAGSISQTFATDSGATYNVTFAMSGNPDNGPGDKTLEVSATGAASKDYTYTVTGSNSEANMNWAPETYSFVAAAATTTLEFASKTDGAYGPALDNVVITEVPATPVTPAIPVYEGNNSCSEGKVPMLLAGLTTAISSTTTSPVTVTLPSSGEYLFEAVGDYGYGGAPANNSLNRADAGYATGTNWAGANLDLILGIAPSAQYRGVTSLLSDMGTGAMGIVDWGTYKTNHDYNFGFTAPGANTPVKFVVSDWYGTWYDGGANNNQGGMWDNSGSLTVNVYSCQTPAPQTATLTLKKIVDCGVMPRCVQTACELPTAWTMTATGATTISGKTGDTAITAALVGTGAYALTENGPDGYDTVGWMCSINSGTATLLVDSVVNLAPGDVATCTITNTRQATPPTAKTGMIKVVKYSIGGTGTFNFTGDLGAFAITTKPGMWWMMKNGSGSWTSGALTAGTKYMVEETVPTGWKQTANTCKNVKVKAGRTVTCVIVNVEKKPDDNHRGRFNEHGLKIGRRDI